MLYQQPGIDAPQVESLAARQYGDRDLADLGRGKNEFRVWRRLLQRLEQSVEGLRRQHMNFVQDVDLVARADRRIADRVVDLAHVIDAVVGGSIHLDDVDVPTLHDGLAVHADDGHLDGGAGDGTVRELVIERAREDARRRGLAHAAHAGEYPSLRQAVGVESVRD